MTTIIAVLQSFHSGWPSVSKCLKPLPEITVDSSFIGVNTQEK